MKHEFAKAWDYLVLTVTREQQVPIFRYQLDLRQDLQLLPHVLNTLVISDPKGFSVGNGGSTLYALLAVINHGIAAGHVDHRATRWAEWLSSLRIVVIHCGGRKSSSPFHESLGKVFLSIPGVYDQVTPMALLDRILPAYLQLPPMPAAGQVVIASGDVLLNFDPGKIRFEKSGISGFSFWASPQNTSHHGAYRSDPDGSVLRYLQKPPVEQQKREGFLNRYGQSLLDIGLLCLTSDTVVTLLELFEISVDGDGKLSESTAWQQILKEQGLELYRELCCALGSETSLEQYWHAVYASGSSMTKKVLERLYRAWHDIPFHVQIIPRCDFYHFGSSQEILHSALQLYRHDHGITQQELCIMTHSHLETDGLVNGRQGWMDACRISAEVQLEGDNLIAGLDIQQPLRVPRGTCLEVLPGHNRRGQPVWFLLIFGTDDNFAIEELDLAVYCNHDFLRWMNQMGVKEEDVWTREITGRSRSISNAHLFLAMENDTDFYRWMGLSEPVTMQDTLKNEWRNTDRFSLEEIRFYIRYEDIHQRQYVIGTQEILENLRKVFHPRSSISAGEIAWAMEKSGKGLDEWISRLLLEADWHFRVEHPGASLDCFSLPRILHTVGTALRHLHETGRNSLTCQEKVIESMKNALKGLRLGEYISLAETVHLTNSLASIGQLFQEAAFDYMSRCILSSGGIKSEVPKCSLRTDEIIWGRAPARLDLGGGWTDTPPYALEFGGCVMNAAVDLNGQPPIQCYARVIPEKVIRVTSIDHGTREEIKNMESLQDYRQATSVVGLAKAALVLSGFSPQTAPWGSHVTLEEMLTQFGGGIELTTLAAIPKGSGLGTSSIMGAVILAVVQKLLGNEMKANDLFHGVLRLEQALTTGGGWQDQIGGVVGAVKMISAQPGLIPDVHIRYVPDEVLDPGKNGGCTLLYYTGITRLAKNILQQVVGRYLDRDRNAMKTLRQLHELPAFIYDAMAGKSLVEFGRCIDEAWKLNKQLDPDSSNASIEQLLRRIRPHIYGAKLLGAGGGGFLLIVCKSEEDACRARRLLEEDPPNELARFFRFAISREGLVVTVC